METISFTLYYTSLTNAYKFEFKQSDNTSQKSLKSDRAVFRDLDLLTTLVKTLPANQTERQNSKTVTNLLKNGYEVECKKMQAGGFSFVVCNKYENKTFEKNYKTNVLTEAICKGFTDIQKTFTPTKTRFSSLTF